MTTRKQHITSSTNRCTWVLEHFIFTKLLCKLQFPLLWFFLSFPCFTHDASFVTLNIDWTPYVTVMVNNCTTTISISNMSVVLKYYVVKNKSDTQLPELKSHSIRLSLSASIYYLPLWLQYRQHFERAGSAQFLHFTILWGGVRRPPAP